LVPAIIRSRNRGITLAVIVSHRWSSVMMITMFGCAAASAVRDREVNWDAEITETRATSVIAARVLRRNGSVPRMMSSRCRVTRGRWRCADHAEFARPEDPWNHAINGMNYA
jgi:hypothetical protein